MWTQSDVICTIGVPAAGKSTFSKRMVSEHGAKVINLDEHFYDSQGVYRWNPDLDAVAWRKVVEELEDSLRQSDSLVVVDDIFLYLPRRKEVIDLAMRYGKAPVAVYFETPLTDCLKRNARRTEDRRIPEDIVRKMYRDMAKPHPNEHWRRIYEYLPDRTTKLLWDRTKNSKSDKLGWAERDTQ